MTMFLFCFFCCCCFFCFCFCFFFNDTATTEIYTLSLHDALPIYIDIDDGCFGLDNKKIKLIKNLRKDCVLLKPGKGNGLVVIDREQYISAVESIFADIRTFKRINTDPTLVRLSSIQSFINTVHKPRNCW